MKPICFTEELTVIIKPAEISMRKRVLHIISGDLWGGKEAQLLMQLPALARLGWDIEVICFNELETSKRYRDAGLHVTDCNEALGFFSLLGAAKQAAKNFEPAIISAHGAKEFIVATFIGRALGVPITITYHGSTEKRRGVKALKTFAIQFLVKLVARFSSRSIMTVSEGLAEELGFEQNWRLDVVRNVTSVEPSPPGIKSVDAPKVLFVGRLVSVKRVDLLIAAIAVLKDRNTSPMPRVEIVGEGPLREGLVHLAETLGVKEYVEFVGFQSDVKERMSKASALIICSDSEGIPTVLLEAIACGLPVVSTELAGVQEVVEVCKSHPVKFIPRNNSKQLADAIQVAVKFTDTSYYSRSLVELKSEFTPETAAKKLEQIYEQVFSELKRE